MCYGAVASDSELTRFRRILYCDRSRNVRRDGPDPAEIRQASGGRQESSKSRDQRNPEGGQGLRRREALPPRACDQGRRSDCASVEGRQGGELRLPLCHAVVRRIDGSRCEAYHRRGGFFTESSVTFANDELAQAENIVEIGEIHPMDVNLPGIYVDRIVPATVAKKIELLTITPSSTPSSSPPPSSPPPSLSAEKLDAHLRRETIAKRAAKELKDGFYVNLGVGETGLNFAGSR